MSDPWAQVHDGSCRDTGGSVGSIATLYLVNSGETLRQFRNPCTSLHHPKVKFDEVCKTWISTDRRQDQSPWAIDLPQQHVKAISQHLLRLGCNGSLSSRAMPLLPSASFPALPMPGEKLDLLQEATQGKGGVLHVCIEKTNPHFCYWKDLLLDPLPCQTQATFWTLLFVDSASHAGCALRPLW